MTLLQSITARNRAGCFIRGYRRTSPGHPRILFEVLRRRLPHVAMRPDVPSRSNPCVMPQFLIVEHATDALGEGVGILWWHQDARVSVLNKRWDAAHGSGDDGLARRHCFQYGER